MRSPPSPSRPRFDKASLNKVSRDIQTVTAPLARVAPAAVLAPTAIAGVGKVVAAAGQLTGVLGLIPAAAGAAGLAFGSLAVGVSGFSDAIKEVGDVEKFNAAVAQLAPNAQQAARSIQGLMPQVTQLKMTVQDALFAGVGEQIQALGTTYLPVFQQVMSQMAGSANRAFTGISKQLQTPEMQEDIKTFGANAVSAFDISPATKMRRWITARR